MSRPEKLNSDGGMGFYSVQVHPLNKEIATALQENGEFFLKSSQQIMDAFGLAYEKKDSIKAIDNIITFTKQLKKLKCHMRAFGFRVIDLEQQKLAITYTIESFRFKNQPLWVNEIFIPRVPLLALVNDFADLWNNAYSSRPQIEIIKISNGK